MSTGWIILFIIQWIAIIFLFAGLYGLLKMTGTNIRKIELIEKKLNIDFLNVTNSVTAKETKYELTKLPKFKEYSITTSEIIEMKPSESGKKTLVILISPSCSSCKEVINMLVVNRTNYLNYLVITSKSNNKNLAKYTSVLKNESIPLVISDELINKFNAPFFPFAILVNQELMIEKSGVAQPLIHELGNDSLNILEEAR